MLCCCDMRLSTFIRDLITSATTAGRGCTGATVNPSTNGGLGARTAFGQRLGNAATVSERAAVSRDAEAAALLLLRLL